MRLGGPVSVPAGEPEQWAAQVVARGYGAAYCPVGVTADDATVRAYARAARSAGIVIAEVGAWSNPLDTEPEQRRAAIEFNKRSLDLADRIDARCCVNIAGFRVDDGGAPAATNFSDETFDMIVEVVREIIDAVRPTRTYYAVELMPTIHPDTPDECLRLIAAVDRERLGAHLDPVNMLSSPRRYYHNADLLAESFAKLGPKLRSCHAKDVILRHDALVRLDEVRPGAGRLDYGAYLRGLASLDEDVPLMLEHLDSDEEYARAAGYIREVARAEGLAFTGPG